MLVTEAWFTSKSVRRDGLQITFRSQRIVYWGESLLRSRPVWPLLLFASAIQVGEQGQHASCEKHNDNGTYRRSLPAVMQIGL